MVLYDFGSCNTNLSLFEFYEIRFDTEMDTVCFFVICFYVVIFHKIIKKVSLIV